MRHFALNNCNFYPFTLFAFSTPFHPQNKKKFPSKCCWWCNLRHQNLLYGSMGTPGLTAILFVESQLKLMLNMVCISVCCEFQDVNGPPWYKHSREMIHSIIYIDWETEVCFTVSKNNFSLHIYMTSGEEE